MSLNPKKFTFKNRHKQRKFLNFRSQKLTYGHFGLKLLQPLWVSGKQILRYKLLIKKSAKRSDKTSRKVWFNLFPHLPMTKKVAGSRMGKGKCKLVGWIAQLSPGVNMFELKNARPGRAVYFFKQVSYRLPVKSKLTSKVIRKIPLLWKSSKKISHENFFS